MRARVTKYPPRTTFHTASKQSSTKLDLAAFWDARPPTSLGPPGATVVTVRWPQNRTKRMMKLRKLQRMWHVMPIEDKVMTYSVSVNQNNFQSHFRQIRLGLESGGTAYIAFPKERPTEWLQFVGSATNLYM